MKSYSPFCKVILFFCYTSIFSFLSMHLCAAQAPPVPGAPGAPGVPGGPNCPCIVVWGEIKQLSTDPKHPGFYEDLEDGIEVKVESKAYAKNSKFKDRNFFHAIFLYNGIPIDGDEDSEVVYNEGDQVDEAGAGFMLEKCGEKNTSDIQLNVFLGLGVFIANSKVAKVDYHPVETIGEDGLISFEMVPEFTFLDESSLQFSVSHTL